MSSALSGITSALLGVLISLVPIKSALADSEGDVFPNKNCFASLPAGQNDPDIAARSAKLTAYSGTTQVKLQLCFGTDSVNFNPHVVGSISVFDKDGYFVEQMPIDFKFSLSKKTSGPKFVSPVLTAGVISANDLPNLFEYSYLVLWPKVCSGSWPCGNDEKTVAIPHIVRLKLDIPRNGRKLHKRRT